MLQNIEVSKIQSHRQNPRKDLGDLTELTKSIKKNGILQNLTVVPWYSQGKEQNEFEYIVVIGHRRLAAAKKAGLKEVPCSIAEMTQEEQLATMLTENMQRADLTVYEQAMGFQMMLDLGESVSSITKKTGFSDSTVRRRVKLLDLDQTKFEQSADRNVTLKEYMELEKIEDLELKNKVLEHAGTPNFENELRRAISKENSYKKFTSFLEQVSSFAEKIDNSAFLRYVCSYSNYGTEEIEVPDDIKSIKYYFVVSDDEFYWRITLYKDNAETEETERIETDEERAAREEREKEEARKIALKETSKRAYQLRLEFAKGISNTKAKKDVGIIIKYLLNALLEHGYMDIDYDDIEELTGKVLEIDPDVESNFDKVVDDIKGKPERYLFLSTYILLDSPDDNYYDWYGEYTGNKELDLTYEFLKEFGYELSDEEKQMCDGTHDLYKIEN